MDGDVVMKSVRSWLFDYFAMIAGTEMEKILADVATREVESFTEARTHVNRRIDMMIDWLDNTRPAGQP